MQRQPHACSWPTSQAQQLCMRANGSAQRRATGVKRRRCAVEGWLQHVYRTLRKMHLIMRRLSQRIATCVCGS